MQDLIGLPGTSLQSISVYLLLLMLSALRIGAFLVASPFFGSRMIPLTVRIVFSIALGLGIMSQVEFPDLQILMGASIVPIVFQEVFVGLACGMVLSICFSSVILAGEKIAATSGLAFAAQIDPTSGAQSPVISQIFQLFLLILFFSLNGHLIIFDLIFKSFELVPVGSFYNFEKVIEEVELNEISKPFETAFGWHILKVLEKRKKNISDEIIKDKAYSVLFKRKFQEQLQNTLEEIRSEAFVDIKISSI